MVKIMNQYDVGYLDLIIADESHHSGYNVHDDLFKYFDALQVSLTATPVDMIGHATYGLFGCEGRLPTAEYSLEAVVADDFLTLENSSICLGGCLWSDNRGAAKK